MHIDGEILVKLADHSTLYACALLGAWLRGRHVKAAALAAVAVLTARVDVIEKFLREHFLFPGPKV